MKSRLALILLASFIVVLPASADTKIKTKNTAMGHSTESTVYIKGARKRDEMQFGPVSHVTILQCDQKRIITLCEGKQSYTVYHLDEEEAPVAPAKTSTKAQAKQSPVSTEAPEATEKGGVQTFTINTTDTGERQTMFGFAARHVKTSMKAESSPDACHQNKADIETDGWYADLSPQLVCLSHPAAHGAAEPSEPNKPTCRDRISFHRTGNGGKTGYPLKATTTIHSEHGDFTSTTEVVELSKAELEPTLFDVPAGYSEVAGSCYGKPSYSTAMAMAAAAPNSTASSGGSCASFDLTNPFACGRWKDETGKYMGVGTGGGSNAGRASSGIVAPPSHSGRVRVGVVGFNAKAGGSSSTANPARQKLIQDILDMNVDAVPLDQPATAGAQPIFDEARQKSCDYVLFTDITDFKAPKVNKKGMFAAALGGGGGGVTPGEVTIAYKMYSIGNNEDPKLDSTQKGTGSSSADEPLGAAVKLESGDVVAKINAIASRK